ncbi:MAG TPA: carbon-nitrogen hydrolase family protein [Bryobacteraceae bacterium]|nr:carbon-nitrogen hydrolase family protein [Bryobacteraceae bacterium]
MTPNRTVGLLLAALAMMPVMKPSSAREGPRRLRVAGAQIPVTRDVSKNLATLERAVQYAAAEKADILLTPEGSLSGYVTDFDAARTAAGLERITETARKSGIALALGTCFQEPEDGNRYDELRFYSGEGRFLGFHAKILLCRRIADPASKGEIDYYSTRPLRTFELNGVTVGGLICNDLWANPEWTPQEDSHLTQQLAGRAVRVIFQAVNSGLERGENLKLNRSFHESNLRIRARAGKLWIVVADAVDPEGRLTNQCPSGVVDPSGHWVVRLDKGRERFFAYTIELK